MHWRLKVGCEYAENKIPTKQGRSSHSIMTQHFKGFDGMD